MDLTARQSCPVQTVRGTIDGRRRDANPLALRAPRLARSEKAFEDALANQQLRLTVNSVHRVKSRITRCANMILYIREGGRN